MSTMSTVAALASEPPPGPVTRPAQARHRHPSAACPRHRPPQTGCEHSVARRYLPVTALLILSLISSGSRLIMEELITLL